MSGPSDKAVEVAFALSKHLGENDVRLLLSAAHEHPSLGLDRSVCLRDVVEALRTTAGSVTTDYIIRKFGGGS